MRFSWDLIRSFQAVARAGSLSAAARSLGLAQPTVGRHIDLLEEALSVPLFRRGREGMTVTARGAELVSISQKKAENADTFERQAAGLEENHSGTIRMSANEVFGVILLPGLLSAFMNQHPDIQIELAVTNEASNLLQRDADIAVRLFRPVQNDLVAQKIGQLSLGLYAHTQYLEAFGEPASMEELRNHSFIGFDRETSLIEAAGSLGACFSAADFNFRSDNILTHISAVRSGVGIGVLHKGLASNWPDVRQVLTDIPLPQLELWIACHADVRYNKRVRLMMDFLVRNLKNPYAWQTI